MKTISKSEITPIKMIVKIPDIIVKSGFKVISNGKIYNYVGIGWVEEQEATNEDYELIPELID